MKTIKRAIDPLNLFNPGKVRPVVLSAVACMRCFCGAETLRRRQLYPDDPAEDPRAHLVASSGAAGTQKE